MFEGERMSSKQMASVGLETFIEEAIKKAKAHGYTPTAFMAMRSQLGTVSAIEKLVQSGDVQSGFKRLEQLGLLEWSIEAAVAKFPIEFTRQARECAEWRLKQVQR